MLLIFFALKNLSQKNDSLYQSCLMLHFEKKNFLMNILIRCVAP